MIKLTTTQLSTALSIPRLMGILNLTPDSFSDGDRFMAPKLALEHATRLIKAGAEIIDLGGESTRPGSAEVPADQEISRVLPVLESLKADFPQIQFSVDTRHAATAEAAIKAGADIINDISALRHDRKMAALLAGYPEVKIILMHMQGQPQTMQLAPSYDDLFGEIREFFRSRIAYCESHGIDRQRLMLDPGIGFGKNLEHNLMLLKGLDLFQELELPIVLGASRKRFIDAVSPAFADQRIGGSLAAALMGALQGAVILRVHDVFEHAQFFKVLNAITGADI